MASEETLACPLCNKTVLQAQDLEDHIDMEHGSEYWSYEAGGSEPAGAPIQACPVCDLEIGDTAALERHVNTHFGDADGGAGSAQLAGVCPMCDVEVGDDEALRRHVNSHFDSPEKRAEKRQRTEERDQDAQLLEWRERQQQEFQRYKQKNGEGARKGGDYDASELERARESLRRQEEERRERYRREHAEFTKLQKQHGMAPGQGGYLSRGTDRISSLADKGQLTAEQQQEAVMCLRRDTKSGVDSGTTCTTGVMQSLQQLMRRGSRAKHYWLADCVNHHGGNHADAGWGCGYRNIQMLLSSLAQDPAYAHVAAVFSGRPNQIPSIPKLQELIEGAWASGYDELGAAQLGRKLRGTSKWIGATEAVTFLSSLRLRCRLLDFHRPTGPQNTHPLLLRRVRDYFRDCEGRRHPLMLQHAGHSRLIVGAEEFPDGHIKLLIFDPGTPMHTMRKLAKNAAWNTVTALRRTEKGLKSRQFQVVLVDGVMNAAEQQASKCVHSERVPP